MPKSHSRRSRRSGSRKRRTLSLAGGSGAAAYVSGMIGPSPYNEVYQNPAHANAPTGGGMWLTNGGNVAYQAPAGSTPLMSGGRRRRSSRRSRRRTHRRGKKSWFPKIF